MRYREGGAEESERLLFEAKAGARRASDAAALAQVLEDTRFPRLLAPDGTTLRVGRTEWAVSLFPPALCQFMLG